MQNHALKENRVILDLVVQSWWYKELQSGAKTEEYRRESKWMDSRLANFYKNQLSKHFIKFRRGYSNVWKLIEVKSVWIKNAEGEFTCKMTFSSHKQSKKPALIERYGYNKVCSIVFELVQKKPIWEK
jgi:hypothetical protein